jgi:hypothetical protein
MDAKKFCTKWFFKDFGQNFLAEDRRKILYYRQILFGMELA